MSLPTVTAIAQSTPTATAQLPPDWNPGASAAGLTLTIKPDHGGVGSGVRIEGSVAPSLRTGGEVLIRFLTDGPHRSLGDKFHTEYRGAIWPHLWWVHLDANGHFAQVVKVPRVIQFGTGAETWSIEPGIHHFALVLDRGHAAFVPFSVDAPLPPPTTSPAPAVRFQHLWLANAQTGWLTGTRCQEPLPPTPDANGNVSPPPPPSCQGVIEHTTDGGQTWLPESLGDGRLIPRAIQFADPEHGWLAATISCSYDQQCATIIFRTTDGGQRWDAVYHTGPNTPGLILKGHPTVPRSAALTTLAFTSVQDGWAFGQACAKASGQDCRPVLLVTHNGGISWDQPLLPSDLTGYVAVDLAHPTTLDGWIVAGDLGATTRLIVTHDGGNSWQTLPDPVSPGFTFAQSLAFQTSVRGWLLAGSQPGAGEQGKEVFATNDGGQSWTKLAWTGLMGQSQNSARGGLPIGGYIGPMVSSSDRDVWIASARGGLLHSADGGKMWKDAPIPSHYFVAVHFADAKNGWALSIEGPGLWATTDGGLTWRQVPLPEGSAP